jgi:hypothetical protein
MGTSAEGEIMPKITISLHGIVAQINKAEKQLAAARNKTMASTEKQKLAVKIKHLKKIRVLVKRDCQNGKKGLNIAVPV